MFGGPILNIQNIIPRWQRDPIISIFVRCHPRDLFFFLLSQDNQGIFGIGFRLNLCARHLIRFSHRHAEDNFQMPFQETLLRCIQ